MNIRDYYVPQQLWELQEWWLSYYHNRKYRGKKKKLLQYIYCRERDKTKEG